MIVWLLAEDVITCVRITPAPSSVSVDAGIVSMKTDAPVYVSFQSVLNWVSFHNFKYISNAEQ